MQGQAPGLKEGPEQSFITPAEGSSYQGLNKDRQIDHAVGYKAKLGRGENTNEELPGQDGTSANLVQGVEARTWSGISADVSNAQPRRSAMSRAKMKAGSSSMGRVPWVMRVIGVGGGHLELVKLMFPPPHGSFVAADINIKKCVSSG